MTTRASRQRVPVLFVLALLSLSLASAQAPPDILVARIGVPLADHPFLVETTLMRVFQETGVRFGVAILGERYSPSTGGGGAAMVESRVLEHVPIRDVLDLLGRSRPGRSWRDVGGVIELIDRESLPVVRVLGSRWGETGVSLTPERVTVLFADSPEACRASIGYAVSALTQPGEAPPTLEERVMPFRRPVMIPADNRSTLVDVLNTVAVQADLSWVLRCVPEKDASACSLTFTSRSGRSVMSPRRLVRESMTRFASLAELCG